MIRPKNNNLNETSLHKCKISHAKYGLMGVDGAAPFGLVSRGNDKDTEKNHYYPVVQKPTQRPGLSASAPPAGLSVSLAGSIMKSKKPRTATSTCANQYRSARPTLG